MKSWWRGAVFYQIYPRSFFDSTGNGVGDLAGISAKLDYVKSLGVDAIWLSPFFRSPMKDFGYDVADYRDVDPLFGSLEDFDRLLNAAHERDLKLVIDQVYSHTSDKHAWFRESRLSHDNSKSDWYVWADAKPDGGPPNNWLSVFGGPAWTWDTRRRQYYLHNFLSSQPDLNFHEPAVRRAILDTARFWLDRGVDGFRLDVANLFYCDEDLRDNPARTDARERTRPYDFQQHRYDRSQPENLDFIASLRELMNGYPNRMAVAEILSDAPLERSAEYTVPGRLHTAYNFFFLTADALTPALVRTAFDESATACGWPSWSFSNHDVVRALSRFSGESPSRDVAVQLNCLLLCLRGTIFLYQGEELGLPQADVPFEALQDPEGIRFWPDNLGRDGARTPMPWRHDAPHAGFSDAPPWLPVDPRHAEFSVDRQVGDRQSILNKTRRMIEARRASDALRIGDIEFFDAPAPLLIFRRTHGAEIKTCVFNLSAKPFDYAFQFTGALINALSNGSVTKEKIRLPPHGFIILDEH